MITIVSFGKIKDDRLQSLAQDYAGRLLRFPKAKCKQLIIADKGVGKNQEYISSFLASKTFDEVCLLDEHATLRSSQELLDFLQPVFSQGKSYCFIIGGAQGFSADFKKNYKRCSLSPMTFTHEMAQVLLLEQLYRVATIEAGFPYHKE